MIFYVVTIAILLWIYVYLVRLSRTKVPPDMKVIPIEKGLPIIGVVKEIKEPLCNYLTKLSKKHGPIYFIKFGMRNVLVLNNFEYMKAALVDNGEAFSGRWPVKLHVIVSKGTGVLYTEGKLWAEQRSFLLRILRDFGVGRSRSVEIVQEEFLCLVKNLEEMKSKKIDFPDFVSLHTANVISKFLMNKRFTHQDPEVKIIDKMMRITANAKSDFSNLCLMLPFVDEHEWLLKFLVWVANRKSLFRDPIRIFRKEIKSRLEILDFNSTGEDLLERLLIKQHQMKEKDGNVGTFSTRQIIENAFELFISGYDTTSSTLTWGLMFMAMYPEVQEKVHEEICDKIGNERLPTMSDKTSLAYTQAVMDEILRLSTVLPLGLIHRTLEDTCVNGYFIPKHTLVIVNLLECHADPNMWEKPLEFYPEHFLAKDEKENYKYKAREELITFGMGKRQCLGESLARTEYFIFFTGILQRFQVSLPGRVTGKISLHDLPSSDGIIRLPHYKDFIFERRN